MKMNLRRFFKRRRRANRITVEAIAAIEDASDVSSEVEPLRSSPDLSSINSWPLAESSENVPSLPLELVEIIIDHCAWNDDRETLYICSLVCHQWLGPSRYHLFSSLLFNSSAGASRILADSDLLSSSFCTVPPFVKRIAIVYDEIVNISHLLPTLALMPNARSLIIAPISTASVKQGYISESTLQTLSQTFSNLTMLEMCCNFVCLQHLIPFVCSFISLEILDLSGNWGLGTLSTDCEGAWPLMECYPPPALKTLRVSYCMPEILAWMTMVDRFPTQLIEVSFDLFILSANTPHLGRFLKAQGSTLKRLILSDYGTETPNGIWDPETILEELNLEYNGGLEYLGLNLNASNTAAPYALLAQGLCAQLTSPVLREVRLEIDTPECRFDSEPEWSRLDGTLAALPSHFLQFVTICANVSSREVEETFSRCKKNNLLRAF